MRSCDVDVEEIRENCRHLDVLIEEIRSGNDVSTREIRSGIEFSRHLTNQSINLLLMAMRNNDVPLKPLLSPPRKTRKRKINNFEVPRRDITENDLETERRRDAVFCNLLLSRHHGSLGVNNEHGTIIAVPRVSSHLLDDEGILLDILSRLPVRSLLRFKSVCKRWLSLIKHNRHFINLHLTRLQSRPNILCITPMQKQIYGGNGIWCRPLSQTPRHCIFLADISSVQGSSSSIDGEEQVPAEAIIRDIRMTTDDDGFVYDLVLKPVNGLIGFVDWMADAIRIYNVSTREVTPWIKSTLLAEEKNRFEKEDDTIEIKIDKVRFPVFQLGFDPSTMEHKVFCFWTLSRTQSFLGRHSGYQTYAAWEALTVGRDTKWRRIHVVPSDNQMKLDEVVPPWDKGSWHVHINGTIYWLWYPMNHISLCQQYVVVHGHIPDPKVIVAFDVGSEKCRVIPIPSFILDEPREERFSSPNAILELNGRVALSYRLSPYILKLWVLDDGVGRKLENCHGNGKNWTAEIIKLPFRCDPVIKFHAVVGTDQIVEYYDDAQRNL
ncbi:hypothetical protein C5167_026129 [Papaver somniferum]|uniref:F-box/kelch-repeat protein At4g19930-like n=1 Tax=Papaver somniferum TaxID=3469 RepID=UPI000E6FD0D7|nr:F-box/kelch-repeat protein At4g19930-like [Papaver somniferum]RZC94398.1 hypothetical protein C5167_026129 [Papaver somniferum]